jgi:hypothetical protein
LMAVWCKLRAVWCELMAVWCKLMAVWCKLMAVWCEFRGGWTTVWSINCRQRWQRRTGRTPRCEGGGGRWGGEGGCLVRRCAWNQK